MKGFQSPNHTQAPNDLFDELLPSLSSSELKVLMVIIRRTLGYHRRHTRLSLRNMQSLTGIKHRNTITKAAASLEKKGLLTRTSDGVSEWTIHWRDTNDDPPQVGVGAGALIEPPEGVSGEEIEPEVVQSVNQSGASIEPPSSKERRKENNKENDSSSFTFVQGKDAITIWCEALVYAKMELNRQFFTRWLQDTYCFNRDGCTFKIAAPDDHARDLLEDRATATMQNLLAGIIGQPATIIWEVR